MLIKKGDDIMQEIKCDCGLNHDMTFCLNKTCNSVRKCMRFGGNHVLNRHWDFFSDYGEGKYYEECNMYIEVEHGTK